VEKTRIISKQQSQDFLSISSRVRKLGGVLAIPFVALELLQGSRRSDAVTLSRGSRA
jgi:hypothetical protein